MECARPGCKEAEDRIDGYCTIYCRDMDELDEEWREKIQAARLEAAVAALNDVLKRVEAGEDFFTARGHVLARIIGDAPAGE